MSKKAKKREIFFDDFIETIIESGILSITLYGLFVARDKKKYVEDIKRINENNKFKKSKIISPVSKKKL